MKPLAAGRENTHLLLSFTPPHSLPAEPHFVLTPFKMNCPCPALVTLHYKKNSISCFNRDGGQLESLGVRIYRDLEAILNGGQASLNQAIYALNVTNVVSLDDVPTESIRQRLAPYTHIYLPTDTINSWPALLYGTQGGIRDMLAAGFTINREELPSADIYVYHYEVDFYAETLSVTPPNGQKATYPFSKMVEAFSAWNGGLLYNLTPADELVGYHELVGYNVAHFAEPAPEEPAAGGGGVNHYDDVYSSGDEYTSNPHLSSCHCDYH